MSNSEDPLGPVKKQGQEREILIDGGDRRILAQGSICDLRLSFSMQEWQRFAMSHNSFGHLFRVTTFGESHGPALGCVVDGCPPGLALDESDLQPWLDTRRPGQNRFVTQRREADRVQILSGTCAENPGEKPRTTGTPIALLIANEDQRSADYDAIKTAFRPGHADYAYWAKYGFRDPRGGGRASARETAARVAAGGVARLALAALYGESLRIRGALVAMGGDAIDRANWDWAACGENPFFCPDRDAALRYERLLDDARKAGSSLGAVVEIRAEGVPAGLGAPLYGKLDSDLAGAMMGINAVKGVEIGSGFALAAMRGEDAADEMRMGSDGGPVFRSNHNGGVLGGISSGQDIVVRCAVKPTSSILIPRRSVTQDGTETMIRTTGRHDPCVGIRAVPVAEAMMALVLVDHALRHRAQTGMSGPLGHFGNPE